VSLALPLLADDGDLDPSFWTDGKVAIDVSADATFGGLASDVAGQLAVAYSYVPPLGAVRVAAWRSVADASLGGACVIEPYPSEPRDTHAIDAAFDAFGRLLVLAKEYRYDPVQSFEAFYVLAYSFPDCVLDASYGGGDGIVEMTGWDFAGFMAYKRLRPLADGTALVTGWGMTGSGLCNVHVFRLDPDGGTVSTFCDMDLPSGVYGQDSALAPNGHVISVAGGGDFRVVDFTPDGTIVGGVTVAFDLGAGNNDHPFAIAATADGRMVVAGVAEVSDSGPIYDSAAVAMLHWNAQGELELDPSFSGDGKRSFAPENLGYSYLRDVVVQGDGRIVATGAAWDAGDDQAMAVVRLTPEGTFDSDFNPSLNGVQIIDFNQGSPYNDYAYRVDLQNGRVVLAGTVDIANGIQSVGVARLLNAYIFADGFEAPQAPGWLWVD
jgi:uncharacterized delta-60 repeat protein